MLLRIAEFTRTMKARTRTMTQVALLSIVIAMLVVLPTVAQEMDLHDLARERDRLRHEFARATTLREKKAALEKLRRLELKKAEPVEKQDAEQEPVSLDEVEDRSVRESLQVLDIDGDGRIDPDEARWEDTDLDVVRTLVAQANLNHRIVEEIEAWHREHVNRRIEAALAGASSEEERRKILELRVREFEEFDYCDIYLDEPATQMARRRVSRYRDRDGTPVPPDAIEAHAICFRTFEDGEFHTKVFVFDSRSGRLLEVKKHWG